MRTESPSGFRHRRTHVPSDEAAAPGSHGVRLETSNGERADTTIALDDAATLRNICLNLTNVRASTDPAEFEQGQSILKSTVFFLRDHRRREAAFEALDQFRTKRDHVTVDHWFCVFVLLDNLKPKNQLPALSAYFSRKGPRNNVEWSLEVMRRWLVRHSTGNNATLRTGAIRHLIRFWENSPQSRSTTAALLAYLLCADPDIRRPTASIRDWASVLMLMPNADACEGTEITPPSLSVPELLVAGGLLLAARNIDAEAGTNSLSTRLHHLLRNELKRAVPYLAGANDFAALLRDAECQSILCAAYRVKPDDYRQRQAEAEARYREALARAQRIAKKAGEILLALLPIAESILSIVASRRQ